MPLRLQVGLQQKVGRPDYGSLGAACQVELELDSQLLDRDPAAFQQQVHQAFEACRQAVQTELARTPTAPAGNSPPAQASSGRQRGPVRRATASQVRALEAIAQRRQLDLTADLERRFGVSHLADLDLKQASRLIEELNQPATGSRA